MVNSFNATKADYSKYEAFKLMEKSGIHTPETYLFSEDLDVNSIINKLGFPLIVKRDAGGRGFDLARVTSKEEMIKAIEKIKSSEDYSGGIIIQKFMQPIEPRDYRVCVVNGEVAYAHGRSLISYGQTDDAWLASASLGSVNITLDEIPKELKDFAIKAAESINAMLDTLDIIKTKEGYLIIEHNPTPQLTQEWEKQLGFSPTFCFAKALYDNYLDGERTC